ncbi:hypothetical protein SBV1_2340010 [Verrucomicrobia bacterium]|nr:hypothetical protein SBV1_2340010 [Verrucomicrobiota bacterium]
MRRLASCGSARALLHPSSILRSRPRPFAQRPFHPFVSLWSILRLWSLLCLRPLLWHNFCEHQHPMRERIVKFLRFCFLPHSGIGRLSFAFLPTLCLGMLGVLCYPFIRDHVSPSPALAFIALLVLALVWALLMATARWLHDVNTRLALAISFCPARPVNPSPPHGDRRDKQNAGTGERQSESESLTRFA